MTRTEIEEKSPPDLSANAWMREICIQLALLNEKKTPIFDRTQPQQQRR